MQFSEDIYKHKITIHAALNERDVLWLFADTNSELRTKQPSFYLRRPIFESIQAHQLILNRRAV